MKFSMYLLLLIFTFCTFTNAEAQSRKLDQRTTISKSKALMPAKTAVKANVKLDKKAMLNSRKTAVKTSQMQRNTQAKAAFGELSNDKDMDLLLIKGFQINIPSNISSTATKPLSIIDLYGDEDKKIGTFEFFDNSASALKGKVAKDKEEGLKMAYSIDMLPNILTFLRNVRNSAIVHNKKTNEAYLSSGKQGGSSRRSR